MFKSEYTVRYHMYQRGYPPVEGTKIVETNDGDKRAGELVREMVAEMLDMDESVIVIDYVKPIKHVIKGDPKVAEAFGCDLNCQRCMATHGYCKVMGGVGA